MIGAGQGATRGYLRESTGEYFHEDGVQFICSSVVNGRDFDRVVVERDELVGRLRTVAASHAALLLKVEGLKAALDKYGRHFGWCAAISSRNTAEGCSCGFDAALSPASGGV